MFAWLRRLFRPAAAPAVQLDPELVAEACARICEARARSLLKASEYPDKRPRISEGLEAHKCAAAVRAGWRALYETLA